MRDCECVACELLDASSDLRATSGSRSRRTRVTLGDARTLTCFAFFPTNFWGEKVTARSLYSLCICRACFYSFCCARLLSYKLLVPHHGDSSNHFNQRSSFHFMGLKERNGRFLFEAARKLDWTLPIISEFTRPSRLCDVLASHLAQRLSALEASPATTSFLAICGANYRTFFVKNIKNYDDDDDDDDDDYYDDDENDVQCKLTPHWNVVFCEATLS